MEYRSPRRGSRWSPVPDGYSAAAAILLLGENYDLRIEGVIRPANTRAAADRGGSSETEEM